MKDIVPILAIFSRYVFFTTMALIGITYTGSDDSKIYVVFTISILIINFTMFINEVVTSKILKKYEVKLLLIPSIFICMTGLTIIKYGYLHSYVIDSLKYFIVWGGGSIFAALYVLRKNRLIKIISLLDIIILIFTASTIFSSIVPVILGQSFSNVGGETYQTQSYISALTVGLTLFLILYNNDLEIKRIFKNKLFIKIRWMILFINIIGIFISGGRGGFILLICYMIYFLVFSRMKSRDNKFKQYKSTFILFVIIIIVWPFIVKNPIIQSGINRSTEFISKDGINWEGTSGRDKVYLEANNVIKKSPIIGNGFGASYYETNAYPHNFFLEIMIEGGIVYLSIIIFILCITYIRLMKMIKLKVENKFIMILSIFTFIQLMFSGSYMRSEGFWFIIAYVNGNMKLLKKEVNI